MNSISRPELSLDWWKNTRPKSHGDKKLDNALGDYEKAEKRCERSPDGRAFDDLVKALAAVIAAVPKAVAGCDRTSDGKIIAALDALLKIAKKKLDQARAQAEGYEESEDDEDEEEDEDEDEGYDEDEDAPAGKLLDLARFKSLLKTLAKGPLPFACAVDRKATYFVLDRTRKGASLKTALEKEAGCGGATYGYARVEAGVLVLDVEGSRLNGLAKKVSTFLAAHQPLPYRKARLAIGDDGEDGDDNEETDGEEPLVDATRPFEIAASVGRGGRNNREDVTAAQIALNKRGANLKIDGLIGPATVKAIEDFQRTIGFAKPDGRIDPGGRTETALRTGNYDAPAEPKYGGKEKGGGGSGGGYGGGGGKGGGGGSNYGGGGGGGGGGSNYGGGTEYGGASGGGYGGSNGGGGASGGGDWGGGGASGQVGYEEPLQGGGGASGASDDIAQDRILETPGGPGGAGAPPRRAANSDAAEIVKKIVGAVNAERKRVEEKVSGALAQLRELERTVEAAAAAEVRRLREDLERELEVGKAKLRELKRAADALIDEGSAAARKALEEAARAASKAMKDQSAAADAGSNWVAPDADE